MNQDLNLPCVKRVDVFDACLSRGARTRIPAEVEAKKICGTCDHIAECLRFNGPLPIHGVVGGRTLGERVRLGLVDAVAS